MLRASTAVGELATHEQLPGAPSGNVSSYQVHNFVKDDVLPVRLRRLLRVDDEVFGQHRH